MRLWRLVDDIINKAIQNGEFDHLPGKGKPIQLQPPNPFESKQETLLNNILKGSGVVPIEVQILKEMEGVRQRLDACTDDGQKHALRARLRELELKYAVQMDARKTFFQS